MKRRREWQRCIPPHHTGIARAKEDNITNAAASASWLRKVHTYASASVRQCAHVSEAAATSGAQSTEAATQLNSLTATAADEKRRRAGYAVLGYAMLCARVCAVRAYVCQCVERSVLF